MPSSFVRGVKLSDEKAKVKEKGKVPRSTGLNWDLAEIDKAAEHQNSETRLYDSLSPEDREIYERIRARREAARAAKIRRGKILRYSIAALLLLVIVLVSVNMAKKAAAKAEEERRIKAEEEAKLQAMLVAGNAETDGDNELVKVAVKELGNEGGEKYWKWWGFDYRVDWCAIFVSWAGTQCSAEIADQVPAFTYVVDGSDIYKSWDRWLEGGKAPLPGYIIFFDRVDKATGKGDGNPDHVGIVTGVYDDGENRRVFTVEGNAGYSEHGAVNDDGSVDDNTDWTGDVRRRGYDIDDPNIMGYGVIGEFPVYDEDL